MCGIIGYYGTGFRPGISTGLNMLGRLEYRGYDSAGFAFVSGNLEVVKTEGSIERLRRELNKRSKASVNDKSIVRLIGHTRWATHGEPNRANAHPHSDCQGNLAVVHNGIIENFKDLKEKLSDKGHTFRSDTDSEVIAHLLEDNLEGRGPCQAFQKTVRSLRGSFALVAVMKGVERIFLARQESPLVVGLGAEETFIASDLAALVEYTDKVVFMEDGQCGYVTPGELTLSNFDGRNVEYAVQRVDMDVKAAEKGGFKHYMLKEIFEQPQALHATIRGRLSPPYLELGKSYDNLDYDGVKFIACGTSLHAAVYGKYFFTQALGIEAVVEHASEYRYGGITAHNPLIIGVSQRGETADTLAALKIARSNDLGTIGVTNVLGSSLTRIVGDIVYTNAGPEIGVAATKTFTTQIAAITVLGLALGRKRTSPREENNIVAVLKKLPRLASRTLEHAEEIRRQAAFLSKYRDIFFIGRNYGYPTALEGALKLKEISYLHAEGYPAGELKHGPLALLGPETPVIALVNDDHTREKMIGNIGEIIARKAPVIALAREGDDDIQRYVDRVIKVPDCNILAMPLVSSIALQLLAYYAALKLGREIDRPRNLAKSVTVE